MSGQATAAVGAIKVAIKNLPRRTLVRKNIINPATGESATDVIYNVMDNSKKLVEKNITTDTSGPNAALLDALSILGAFGISIVEEKKLIDTSLLDNPFVDKQKMQNLKKTQDENPNRLQEKKFKN